jgi:para-nitrobenzyl esterase
VFDPLEFAFNHNWGYTNENCQTLNVWSQGINDGKKRPVMVWLHGGGFSAGSAIELPSYEGENLSKKGDVVVVSINHRLNVLGFLDLSSFGDKYKKSANVGMMDAVMALEWVKSNIANFGGDPNNVTIFGQSGGGAKVTTLMYAPSAKGLFHKAINQSGSYRQSFWNKKIAKKWARLC